MGYAFDVGLRYLRSKKRATVSVISIIAVTGVALGVGALLSVVSITSGFQEQFRNKVLGVNAHVLVLKYGLNFEEYRDVVDLAREQPGVRGAAPFIINEMMMAKGDRLSGVLIKGVDPTLMRSVLDLPSQLVAGSLEGLRLPDAVPPVRPEDLAPSPFPEDQEAEDKGLDALLQKLTSDDEPGAVDPLNVDPDALLLADENTHDGPDDADEQPPALPDDADEALLLNEEFAATDLYSGPLAEAAVPSIAEMNDALQAQDELATLPDDDLEAALFAPEHDSPADQEQLPGVVVGVTLAENLGLHVDDTVKIISQLSGVDTSMFGHANAASKARDFKVLGIFEAGFQEYDSKLVYMDLYEAQAFQDQGDTVIGVEISLNDIEQASETALHLERELGGGPFHTMDWKELNNNLFTALETQKIMLSLVIATIILVAAFNVIATLIMVVLEKRREVAILKAMGAKDSAIMRIFMVQGTAIGLVGTTLGLILGGAVCAYLSVFRFALDPKVYLIDHVPVRTSPTEFLITIVIALFICVSATMIPSWWAARMLPAEGVRPQ